MRSLQHRKGCKLFRGAQRRLERRLHTAVARISHQSPADLNAWHQENRMPGQLGVYLLLVCSTLADMQAVEGARAGVVVAGGHMGKGVMPAGVSRADGVEATSKGMASRAD